jgi:DNA-directed RNA polymerase subunit RPC12/RpoP
MKPLRVVYSCVFCGNEHIEVIFSSEETYQVKNLRCNKCESGRKSDMYRQEEDVDEPEIGQVA